MGFQYNYSPGRGTQYLVRFHTASGWQVKVFNKRNCGTVNNAQKKAYAFWATIKASGLADVILRPQILQN